MPFPRILVVFTMIVAAQAVAQNDRPCDLARLSSKVVARDQSRTGPNDDWFDFVIATEVATDRKFPMPAHLGAPFIKVTREEVYPRVETYGANRGQSATLWPTVEIVAVRADLAGSMLRNKIIVDRQRFDVIPTMVSPGGTQVGSDEPAAHVRTALDYLYAEAYAKQGAERNQELTTYATQDLKGADRTTHLVVMVNGEVMGHLQVQTATGEEPLNLDQNLGWVARDPKALSTELGRLNIRRLEDLSPATRRLFETDRAFRELVKHKLYQKTFSYLNSDVQPDYVFGQCNQAKRDKFTAPDSPILFSPREERQTRYGPEYVLQMSKKARLKTEERHIKEIMKLDLQKYLAEAGVENKTVTLSFSRNERDALVRLGIVKLDRVRSTVQPHRARGDTTQDTALRLSTSDFRDLSHPLFHQGYYGLYKGNLDTMLRGDGLNPDFLFATHPDRYYGPPNLFLTFSPAGARAALRLLQSRPD